MTDLFDALIALVVSAVLTTGVTSIDEHLDQFHVESQASRLNSVQLTDPPAPPPPPTVAPAITDPREIIRAVFPDHMEATALRVCECESRFKVDAFNGSCCYGLFQIHFRSHQSWLDEEGVYVASDLYDPWKNARAALRLVQMPGGGWDDWSCY